MVSLGLVMQKAILRRFFQGRVSTLASGLNPYLPYPLIVHHASGGDGYAVGLDNAVRYLLVKQIGDDRQTLLLPDTQYTAPLRQGLGESSTGL